MSEVYIKEPSTNGKVILRTTHGDLEVELWATECPKACRNFCTLCMEGYYDNTIFHRVIKDFIIQGGDATGTGQGCESIYGKPYPDEIHPRLKFRYRGMMGIASAGKKGVKSNGSQFFIVMNRSPTLDGKHTLFAKVVGQTVYNLVRLNDVEVDKNDCPRDPAPRILRTEVVWDPFGDLEPRFKPPVPVPSKPSEQPHRREAIKNKNVLSFGGGDSDEDDDDGVADINAGGSSSSSFGKVKSAHDVLQDPRLLKESACLVEPQKGQQQPSKASQPEPRSKVQEPPPGKPKAAEADKRKAASDDDDSSDSSAEADFDVDDDEDESGAGGAAEEAAAARKAEKRQEAILKLKRDIATVGAAEPEEPKRMRPSTELVEELRTGYTTRAPRAKARGKEEKRKEADDLQKLMKSFGSRVKEAASQADAKPSAEKDSRKEKEQGTFSSIWEEGDEESTTDWLTGGGLKFHTSADKAFKIESLKAKEQLEIFDPLAAKGNAEVLADQRKRRSEQLKPSMRRQEPPKW